MKVNSFSQSLFKVLRHKSIGSHMTSHMCPILLFLINKKYITNAISVINALKCVTNGHKYDAKDPKSIKSIVSKI